MAEIENPLRDGFLAEESQQGADDALALPQRLERYSIAHHRALHMADYARMKKKGKLADKLQSCGHWLLFRDYYTIGKVKLHQAMFCDKHLLCPLCAIRRGARYLRAYLDRLKVVQAQQPTLKAFLVTVTVKDGEQLKERFYHLRHAMQRMTQARRDYLKAPNSRRHVEFAKAVGGVHSIEAKRGKNSGLWHPHAHMVWLCHEKPDQAKLSQEWHEWTGDSFIVDVTEFHDQADIVSGFLEVFKYALKFSELPLEDNWQAFEDLSTKRLVDSFGCLRGVEVPETLDEVHDDLPYIEMLYEYSRSGYQLRKYNGLDTRTGEVSPERIALQDVMLHRDSYVLPRQENRVRDFKKAIFSLYKPPDFEPEPKPAACASEDCRRGEKGGGA
jgi:hypothetical protein